MNKALTSSEKLLSEGSSILIALPWKAKAAAFAEAFRALGWIAEIAAPEPSRASAAHESGFDVVIKADCTATGTIVDDSGATRIAIVARQPSRADAPVFSASFDPSTPLFDIAAAALSLARAARGRTIESCDAAPAPPRQSPRLAARPVHPATAAAPAPAPGAIGKEDAARVLSALKMRDVERLVITAAMKDCGSAPKAARRLGLSPSTLYRKMEGWTTHSD